MSVRLRRANSGAVIVEFAVLIPLLVIVCLVGLDISLAILGKIQMNQSAAAAAEVVAIRGYDAAEAAKTAAVNSVPNPIIPLTVDQVTVSPPKCGCHDASGILTLTTPIELAPTAPCSTAVCPHGGVFPSRFSTITVTGNYTPLVLSAWPGVVDGKFQITTSLVARVY